MEDKEQPGNGQKENKNHINIPLLVNALGVLHDAIVNNQEPIDGFSLDKFLLSNKLISESQQGHIMTLPQEVQEYINKDYWKYVEKIKNDDKESFEKLAKITSNFFEVQEGLAAEPNVCNPNQPPEWADVINGIAVEMRRYYGLREGDEEWPCWNK